MDNVYVDYENTDILDMSIGEECIECALVGTFDVDETINENAKAEVGSFPLDKKGKNKFWVYVGSKERGSIPHVHILKEKNTGDESAFHKAIILCLLDNAYFIHAKSTRDNVKQYKIGSKKEFNKLIEFLESPYTGKRNDVVWPGATVWEAACLLWNDLNGDHKIPTDDIRGGMPKYDFSSIQNYNEQ